MGEQPSLMVGLASYGIFLREKKWQESTDSQTELNIK